MNFISDNDQSFYDGIVEHLESLNITFEDNLQSEILCLTSKEHVFLEEEFLNRLRKGTEVARSPDLYEKVLPDVKKSMETEKVTFQNRLGVLLINLEQAKTESALQKAVWSTEGILLLISMFVAGMWFNDPEGNYEPLLVGLGIAISLLSLWLKFGRWRNLT